MQFFWFSLSSLGDPTHAMDVYDLNYPFSYSVFLASGLGTLFGKVGLPAFNLPFVVAAFTFIAAAGYTSDNPHFPMKKGSPPGDFDIDQVHWGKVRPAPFCVSYT